MAEENKRSIAERAVSSREDLVESRQGRKFGDVDWGVSDWGIPNGVSEVRTNVKSDNTNRTQVENTVGGASKSRDVSATDTRRPVQRSHGVEQATAPEDDLSFSRTGKKAKKTVTFMRETSVSDDDKGGKGVKKLVASFEERERKQNNGRRSLGNKNGSVRYGVTEDESMHSMYMGDAKERTMEGVYTQTRQIASSQEQVLPREDTEKPIIHHHGAIQSQKDVAEGDSLEETQNVEAGPSRSVYELAQENENKKAMNGGGRREEQAEDPWISDYETPKKKKEKEKEKTEIEETPSSPELDLPAVPLPEFAFEDDAWRFDTTSNKKKKKKKKKKEGKNAAIEPDVQRVRGLRHEAQTTKEVSGHDVYNFVGRKVVITSPEKTERRTSGDEHATAEGREEIDNNVSRPSFTRRVSGESRGRHLRRYTGPPSSLSNHPPSRRRSRSPYSERFASAEYQTPPNRLPPRRRVSPPSSHITSDGHGSDWDLIEDTRRSRDTPPPPLPQRVHSSPSNAYLYPSNRWRNQPLKSQQHPESSNPIDFVDRGPNRSEPLPSVYQHEGMFAPPQRPHRDHSYPPPSPHEDGANPYSGSAPTYEPPLTTSPLPIMLPPLRASTPKDLLPDRQDSKPSATNDDNEHDQQFPYYRNGDSRSEKWKRKRRPRMRSFSYHHGHESGARAETDPKGPVCHLYSEPRGKEGEPLSINVGISRLGKNVLGRSSAELWPWSNTTEGCQMLKIVGARRCFDGESQHTLDLTCSPRSAEIIPTKDSMRWIHVKRESLDFDEFKDVALNLPSLSQDWSIVLLSLFKRIRALHYDQLTNRFSPWILRADSAELGLPGTGGKTLSATSISFPYFELGSVLGHGPKNTDRQFPIMSLYEWDDRVESVKEWDAEQSFRLTNDGIMDRDSIIYVPHVWALIFDDTMITYGTASFNDLVSDSIKVLELDQKMSKRATSVEIIDLQNSEFALSLSQCQTFFALKQSIKIRHFANLHDPFDKIDIVGSDNHIIDGEKWVSILQEHTSGAIRLRLRQKRRRSLNTETSKPGICSQTTTLPKKRSLNTESSSDSESTTKERTSKAMPSVKPILKNTGALVLYNSGNSLANGSKIPEMDQLSLQDQFRLSSTSLAQYHADQRQKRLQEDGVIVFDHKTLLSSPEVYTPFKTAVRFDLPPIQSETMSEAESTSSGASSHNQSTVTAEDDEMEGEVANKRDSIDYKSSISIPHFLSWATSQENTGQETCSESSIEPMMKVLDMVHDTLQTIGPARHKRYYRRSMDLPQIELEDKFPTLKAYASDAAKVSDKSLNRPLLIAECAQEDRVRTSQLEACERKLEHLYSGFTGFLSLYVPLDSEDISKHPVMLKCWGALETVLLIITADIEDDAFALNHKVPEWWIVRDPLPFGILSNRKKPIVSGKECKACQETTHYPTIREAGRHVWSKHYERRLNVDDERDIHALATWLRNDNEYYADLHIELYIQFLDRILEPVQEVYRRGRNIWDGVASDNRSMPSGFMLPKSLVNAFESAVLLLVCAAKTFSLLRRRYSPLKRELLEAAMSKDNEMLDLDLFAIASKDMLRFGKQTKEYMKNAEQDVMLGAYTDVDTETVSYASIGPEYILATVMANLFKRPLHANQPIDFVYAGFNRRLHRDAIKHPRTRILGRIWRMREELGLIAEINMMQQEILSNYRRILEPCTFRATTLLRATRFKVEAHFIGIQLQNTHAVHLHLSDINSRLKDVSNHVSRMLKVQQENNGNTIIVFTIVTIIFLPLSWATSYLGMNTSDIRDLQQGQWLFWLIAVPVTTAVIGVAVLVVLKGESIREFFIRREAAKDGQRGGPSNMALKRRLSIRMTDDSMVRRRTTLEPDDNDSWRRFRKRSTRIRGEGEV